MQFDVYVDKAGITYVVVNDTYVFANDEQGLLIHKVAWLRAQKGSWYRTERRWGEAQPLSRKERQWGFKS